MTREKLTKKEIEVARLLAQGSTEREVCKELRIGKGTIFRLKKRKAFNDCYREFRNSFAIQTQEFRNDITANYKGEITETYLNYQQELKILRERQKKWSAAISETGIRCLKLTNSYLAYSEKIKPEAITNKQLSLIKVIPQLMRASFDAIESASGVDDKAYCLAEVMAGLDELQKNMSKQSEPSYSEFTSTRDN